MILPLDRLLTVACTTVLSAAARPHVSDVESGGEKPALPSRAMKPKWGATKELVGQCNTSMDYRSKGSF